MKESYSNQEKFISSLLIFVFIFIIIVIAVLALHYSGILNLKNESSDTTVTDSTSESFATYPSDFSSSESLQTTSQTTEETTVSTKYLPATVPTYIPPTTTSTTKTTASKAPEQTTGAEHTTEASKTTETTTQTQETPPADQPQGGITAEDITDEKMEELITKKYLSIHKNSRPGYKLTSLQNIVVHYVANAGTTADQNWRNFENNKPGTSAHFIIDLDGSILQCMPLNEVAWAIGTPEGNYTSISIECCHPDETGVFTEETYESLVKLVSWLCAKFDLTEENVKRHYDYVRYTSSGKPWHKNCPKYYVENPEKWEAFKEDLYIA